MIGGLWYGSDLSKYFNNMGIFHADDMSGIILTSLYRKIVGKDRNLDEQVKWYREYWGKEENNFILSPKRPNIFKRFWIWLTNNT